MKRQLILTATAVLLATSAAYAQHAVEVISYDQGAVPSPGYMNATSALGEPQRDTEYGAVTPFNPAFATDDLVSLGEGGQLTLRLSHYVVPQASQPEIGVFVNVGINDIAWPAGQAGDPAQTFSQAFGGTDEDYAEVSVSEDGATWVSLGEAIFWNPSAGYTNAAATTASDFQQPFTGDLASFDGLDFGGMLTMLGGSGGGTWLDISATGLSQVGYVRFDLADDLDAQTELNFDLDAVTISYAAVGQATVPEPAAMLLLLLAAPALTTRRHG